VAGERRSISSAQLPITHALAGLGIACLHQHGEIVTAAAAAFLDAEHDAIGAARGGKRRLRGIGSSGLSDTWPFTGTTCNAPSTVRPRCGVAEQIDAKPPAVRGSCGSARRDRRDDRLRPPIPTPAPWVPAVLIRVAKLSMRWR
jgi:hypothetical protein